ncbi:homocysteine S-methyltransferase family protein [Pectobacteriaceae bacterium CE70]|uniref:Homocysteine S-methyltransferase family protein n=1 Tax=Serratia sp. (strain ATCC 39006) TaxID=104623 RepID=A0A2I5T3V3_SERS3|nr:MULTISPECIES: homocysteine S-methyltransferase family protein [Enterobacterales]WJV57851.1 homocysteine S-methyltransferase family protein [Pectobacteriaceae bacterium C111]WJV66443.1 homocysteine S-methyltransferase family protein [Pectobacteriaceae bacterium CE70]WJY10449.1 homocysteine S-methyltransferase family protein [Pectobacteriaceae bacterium C80]WJY15507.1 homocysteine S-methyltransferase family protein [Pectobacteriaceae bacterium CE90]AUG99247.1 homocysteine S-methyltransferase 
MAENVLILDGGMGRELARIGAPFRQPEWSALALMESPQHVRQVHDSFIAAGAQVITTNSYAVVPFHIGDAVFQARGHELAALAGQLARQAADAAPHPVRVAGSLPPVLGSYRPDLFDAEAATPILRVLIDALTPYIDVWLAETQSSLAEVALVRELLGDDQRELWISFTLQDDLDEQGHARLRSGETVTAAAETAIKLGAANLLFNCSRPEVMAPAVAQASTALRQQQSTIGIGVYANAFEPEDNHRGANEGLSRLRVDTHPEGYLQWATEWVAQGATLVGGCCGIGPEHIARLAQSLPR